MYIIKNGIIKKRLSKKVNKMPLRFHYDMTKNNCYCASGHDFKKSLQNNLKLLTCYNLIFSTYVHLQNI